MEITKEVVNKHMQEFGVHMEGFKQGYASAMAWVVTTLEAKEEQAEKEAERLAHVVCDGVDREKALEKRVKELEFDLGNIFNCKSCREKNSAIFTKHNLF
jgi:hypothetical protein